MADDNDKISAQLNDVTQLLQALTAGRLKDILKPGIGGISGGGELAGCTSNCDCKGGYCGCNASVTAFEQFGSISFPDYMQMREARMKELQMELKSLEGPDI